MIKRKITSRLKKFYEDNGRYALLIDGARQVGKTFVVEAFAKAHYENVIEINFIKMPNAKLIFSNVEDEKEILVKLQRIIKVIHVVVTHVLLHIGIKTRFC